MQRGLLERHGWLCLKNQGALWPCSAVCQSWDYVLVRTCSDWEPVNLSHRHKDSAAWPCCPYQLSPPLFLACPSYCLRFLRELLCSLVWSQACSNSPASTIPVVILGTCHHSQFKTPYSSEFRSELHGVGVTWCPGFVLISISASHGDTLL